VFTPVPPPAATHRDPFQATAYTAVLIEIVLKVQVIPSEEVAIWAAPSLGVLPPATHRDPFQASVYTAPVITHDASVQLIPFDE
jgi:hypothetical protein